ncbi:unnamed protein product [Urochloa humidicola]
MACKPCYNTNNASASHMTTKMTPFPRAPAPPQQPPLLPLPAHASPQHSFQPPASRPVSRAKKPRCHDAAGAGASAPIAVVAAPSRKRMAPAAAGPEEVAWTGSMDSPLYSVSPPPSSVPMPTSLLLTVAAARKAPTACAVEVGGGGVDVGATDELRRLLRL